MYRFHKLRFIYRPSCSTATAGYIAVGFDFDFYDTAPSKAAILAWQYSSKGAVWETVSVDASSSSRVAIDRYCTIRSNTGDSRFDQLGNIYVLAGSATSITAIDVGELYVSYDVELKIPELNIPPAVYSSFTDTNIASLSDFFQNGYAGSFIGNAQWQIVDSLNAILFTPGSYMVQFQEYAASGINTVPGITFSVPSAYPGTQYTANTIGGSYSSSGTFALVSYLLVLTAGAIKLTLGALSGSTTGGVLRLSTYKGA